MIRDQKQEVDLIPFAIIVNPKNGVPVLCAITDSVSRLDVEMFSLSGTWMHGSILDFDDPIAKGSGIPKVHIGIRKEAIGLGYGTVGYAAAAVASDMIFEEKLWTKSIESHVSGLSGFESGISSMKGARSDAADRWWLAASKIGFSKSKYAEIQFEADPSDTSGSWVVATESASGKKISNREATDVVEALLKLIYPDLESVDLDSATISFRFRGTMKREMKIDTLQPEEVFRRNLVLALPRRFEAYRTSSWSEPIYATQSPENWQIVSAEALKNVNIASFKPVNFGHLPPKEDPFPIGRREYAKIASWWMKMLSAQDIPPSTVDLWRGELASFGASGWIGSRVRPWHPPRLWADLP